MAFLFVPSHVNETTDPVDNLGGILSVVLVGALILSINFAPVPNEGALVLGLAAIALAALVAFFVRQRRAANPLYDLNVAGRRIFWVAACAGIIVFGSLMAAMFVSQQYLQNVLGLLDTRGRRGDPARGARDGRGRAAVCEAHRGSRFPVHAALRLRVPVPRVPLDAADLGRGLAVLAHRGSRTSSSAPASDSRVRPPRTR